MSNRRTMHRIDVFSTNQGVACSKVVPDKNQIQGTRNMRKSFAQKDLFIYILIILNLFTLNAAKS